MVAYTKSVHATSSDKLTNMNQTGWCDNALSDKTKRRIEWVVLAAAPFLSAVK